MYIVNFNEKIKLLFLINYSVATLWSSEMREKWTYSLSHCCFMHYVCSVFFPARWSDLTVMQHARFSVGHDCWKQTNCWLHFGLKNVSSKTIIGRRGGTKYRDLSVATNALWFLVKSGNIALQGLRVNFSCQIKLWWVTRLFLTFFSKTCS